jgi:Zn-dependent protease/CBS domain-containing protein
MKIRNSIYLGKILGIPIGLDYSWFLVFGFLTWILAVQYYPLEFRNWPVLEYWITSAVTAILLFVSVLLHELGHSVIAMHYKIKVKRISLFIFGGVAEIAGEPPKASAEFWIAIAGPFVSFVLALLFKFLESTPFGFAPLWALLKYLAYINFILAVFNLIPGFPLDGGRVLRAIVWAVSHNFKRATSIAANIGRFFGFFFIFIGAMQILSGNIGNGLWIAFIGWFLESAAVSQIRQQALHDILANHTISETDYKNFNTVVADTTILDLVEHHILTNGRRNFLVKNGQTFLGLLTLHRIKNIPRENWSDTYVTEAMIPEKDLKKIDSNISLWTALQKMDQDNVNQLPVLENGRIVGILSRENIITFISNIQELGIES